MNITEATGALTLQLLWHGNNHKVLAVDATTSPPFDLDQLIKYGHEYIWIEDVIGAMVVKMKKEDGTEVLVIDGAYGWNLQELLGVNNGTTTRVEIPAAEFDKMLSILDAVIP